MMVMNILDLLNFKEEKKNNAGTFTGINILWKLLPLTCIVGIAPRPSKFAGCSACFNMNYHHKFFTAQ